MSGDGRRGSDVVEDVADLMSWGESPEHICTRLDMSAAAITRALERHNRPDLARAFRPMSRGDHERYLERERERWARSGGRAGRTDRARAAA